MKKLLVLAALASACGSGNPTAPTVTPSPPQTVTLSGRVTAVNGGQGLAGVQAALGTTLTQTGADGGFTVTTQPTGALSLSLTGSSIVPRTLQIAATGSRELAVDAIALDGTFSLPFYQAFVRDRLESSTLQPLRRWTTDVNLYLQTSAGGPTADMVESVIKAAVPDWTNGRLKVVSVERGSGTRVGQAGWLTVIFDPTLGHCGTSDVGRSGGRMTLNPERPSCGRGAYALCPTIVRHEVGHALGFYHVDNPADVMYATPSNCDLQVSAQERYHAAIAYNRPVGNQDPDSDLAAMTVLTAIQKP